MVFRTVHGNEGAFWFFNLEKDSVQERPTVWNLQNTDWVETGTQLTCYKQAALTADKEALFTRAKLLGATYVTCCGQRPGVA